MAQIFIANIGNRDVQIEINGTLYQLDGRKRIEEQLVNVSEELAAALEINLNLIGTRALGKWLLEEDNFNKHSGKLRLPILQPVFNELKNRIFDQAYLVVTNQPETVAPFHRGRDTIFAAHLISRLAEKHGFESVPFKYIEMTTGEPDRYDEVYFFLGEQLRDLISKEDNVVAALSGGIPAISAVIRDYVLGICGRKATLIQTEEPSRAGEPGRAEFISSWLFRRDQILRQVRELLTKSYDYAGALNLLEDEGFASDEIRAVLEHADKRSQFDWKAAVQALYGFTQTDSRIQQWYDSANHKKPSNRLRDVVDCADLALRRGHWRDFIVLVDTFVENAWRVLAEEILTLSFGQKRVRKDYIEHNMRQHLEKNKELKLRGGDYLINKAFCEAVVKYNDELTYKPLQQEFAKLKDLLPAPQNRSELIEKINQIDKPVGYLRDQVVHCMANLSRRELEAETRKYFTDKEPLIAIINEMRNLLTKFGEPTTDSCFLYNGINDFALESLQSKAG